MGLLEELQDIPRDDWAPAWNASSPPVSDDEAIRNIKESVNFKHPVMIAQRARPGSCLYAGGGPTLRQFLPEIKRRKDAGEYLITSNKTHDYLVENGIIPDACVLLDPKEIVREYVLKVQPNVAYIIGTCCNPDVWKLMESRGAKIMKILVAYGMAKDADMKLLQELYPSFGANSYLVGGTMTGLRVWLLAVMLGFSKLELYGFDSCYANESPKLVYFDDPDFNRAKHVNSNVYKDDRGEFVIDEPEDGGFFYAYKKKRAENVKFVEHEGRVFLSSKVLIHQAMQIEKWYERLQSQLDVVIHGDSLASWTLECYKQKMAERIANIGDRRWTEEYGVLMRSMHEKGNFGIHGYTDIEWTGRALVSMLCTLQRPIRVLDYGAGAGTWGETVEKVFSMVSVYNYDPFHPKWRDLPDPAEQFDVVNCTDVLEHVEPECVDNTLQWIADHTKFMACFSIGLEDAKKFLPDGRNAHITLRPPKWWAEKLRKHFAIVDYLVSAGSVVFVGQVPDIEEKVEADGAYDRSYLGGRLRLARKIGGM